jgi:hypothetical protein
MAKKQCKQCGKKFSPKLDTQEDCSELCLANRFDTYTRKTRKLAKIFAATMGYRSMSEVRFAAELNHLKVSFKYEDDVFRYQHKPQNYKVDFTLKNGKGKPVYIEYKGKLGYDDRRKLVAVKNSNPKIDLRLVFERPNNRIYRGAKTRYWEWAEKKGFKWYDSKDIKKLKSDISGGANGRRSKDKDM